MNITIREDFKKLIPPLTRDEYAGLEADIIANGCRDALVVWNGILVDGHNRYEICTRNGIPFRTVEMSFENENDAKIWMIDNQISRRNLESFQIVEMRLMKKPLWAAKAKENQGTRNDISMNSSKCSEPINTRKQIAQESGVSEQTVQRVEKILQSAPTEIVEKARLGEISINQAYEVLNMSESQQVEIVERIAEGEHPKDTIKDVKQKPHVANNSGNNEWYTPSEYTEAAREVMGSIDLDPASCEFANGNVKANKYFTIDDDGLSHEWYGNVWLNPPYAAGLVDRFADKIAMREYKQAVILVNNATETAWFNTIIQVASAVVFPKARIRYLSVDGEKNTPLQGQAFIYVGDNTERFIDIFSRFGWSAKL